MTLNFPANPVTGQTYRYPDPLTGPSTYIYNGTYWYVAASSGGDGPDPVPGGTVTNVLGRFPIVSNQTPPQPEIAINQAGLNTSEFNNDAGFIENPVVDLGVTNSLDVGDITDDPQIQLLATGDATFKGNVQLNTDALEPLPPD